MFAYPLPIQDEKKFRSVDFFKDDLRMQQLNLLPLRITMRVRELSPMLDDVTVSFIGQTLREG